MLAEQWIAIVGTIIIPLIGILVYKKRNSIKHKTVVTTDGVIIENLVRRINGLEDSIVKNHMELDEAKLDIAYLKGRDSKHG